VQLEHSFSVPVGVEEAWPVLLDIERIAPCMPGAKVDSVDGDDFTGTVKVKLGPIALTYKGKASFVEKDEAAHRAVIDARGRDARGNGTAAAKVTATLRAEGARSTKVDVVTDLDITGKPAQFGRGVRVDVGNKLIGQFADCLAGKLAGGGAEPEASAAPAADAGSAAGGAASDTAKHAAESSAATAPPRPAAPAPEPEPINLIESAGPAIAKRVAPIAGVALLLLLLLGRRRKHRRH
jgi:carbon monoxide dehydrogenase subunit G